jgi:hypothetical protein
LVISSLLFLLLLHPLSPPPNTMSQSQEAYVCEEQTYEKSPPSSPSVLLPSSQPVVTFANEGASQALLEGDDESNHPSPTTTTDVEEEGEDDRPSPSAPPAEKEKEKEKEEEEEEENEEEGEEEEAMQEGEWKKRSCGT